MQKAADEWWLLGYEKLEICAGMAGLDINMYKLQLDINNSRS
jgi:hypothetical protein